MRIDRLKVLADHLDTVPAERFNMGVWYDEAGQGCGAVACAFGHACLIPEFQEAGLRLENANANVNPVFGQGVGFSAAELFFELHFRQVSRLFSCSSYPSVPRATPAQVAARIREMIASTA